MKKKIVLIFLAILAFPSFSSYAGSSVHILFENEAAGELWARQNLPLILPSGKSPEILHGNENPGFEKAKDSVHHLWGAFRSLFPAWTEGLNEPPVLILRDSSLNAFVAPDAKSGKTGHLIFINSGLIDATEQGLPYEAMTGVIAHELAHSVFRHLAKEMNRKLFKVYDYQKNPFGFLAQPEARSLKTIELWKDGAEDIGEFYGPRLSGLPTPGFKQPTFLKFWAKLLEQSKGSSSECDQAQQAYARWLSHFSFSPGENEFLFTSTEGNSIDQLASKVIQETTPCFKNRQTKFEKVASQVFGISSDQLKKIAQNFKSNELTAVRAFDSAPNVFLGLIRAGEVRSRQMTRAMAKLKGAQLAQYTFEQHADEASVLVHRFLGANPQSISTFFWDLMGKQDPAGMRACEAILKKTETPPPGSFSDAHPSLCTRILQVMTMSLLAKKENDLHAFADYFLDKTVGRAPDAQFN